MKTLKRITLHIVGIVACLILVAYVYLYQLPKGPKITEVGSIATGISSFVMGAYKNSERKSIKVWTNKPEGWVDGDRILFVMHGAGRNADDYLQAWVDIAAQKNILIVAPEFESPFSRIITNDYAEGNLFTFFGVRNPIEEWAFTVVENIFDHIVGNNNLSNSSYDIFGHSAGGQFVHRMVLMKPEARIETAIAANSGTYMFVNPEVNFPYGMGGTPLNVSGLRNSLQKKLVILLGEQDNTIDQGILDQSEVAMDQGAHRLARGSNFYSSSERYAREHNIEFNWKIGTVQNVGHDYIKMSDNAVAYLY